MHLLARRADIDVDMIQEKLSDLSHIGITLTHQSGTCVRCKENTTSGEYNDSLCSKCVLELDGHKRYHGNHAWVIEEMTESDSFCYYAVVKIDDALYLLEPVNEGYGVRSLKYGEFENIELEFVNQKVLKKWYDAQQNEMTNVFIAEFAWYSVAPIVRAEVQKRVFWWEPLFFYSEDGQGSNISPFTGKYIRLYLRPINAEFDNRFELVAVQVVTPTQKPYVSSNYPYLPGYRVMNLASHTFALHTAQAGPVLLDFLYSLGNEWVNEKLNTGMQVLQMRQRAEECPEQPGDSYWVVVSTSRYDSLQLLILPAFS